MGVARPARHAPRGLRLRRHQRHRQYGLACLELEAATAAPASSSRCRASLAMFPIWKFGSEEQKQEWLPRMAAGEVIGCFGLTEPDSRQRPVLACAPRARRDGDDWVLNGTKMWITNGGIADVAVVWARGDAEDGDGRRHPRLHRPHRHARLQSPTTSTRRSRCGRRSPASWSSTTCACPTRPASPRCRRCGARSRASTRRATGSSGAPSAPARACYEAALDVRQGARAVRQAHRRRSSSPSASSSR